MDSCRTYFVARSKLGTTKRNGQSKCARNAPPQMILYFLLAHLTAESGALMISEILGKVIRTPLPQCRFQVSTLIPKTPLIVYAGTGDRDVTSRTHRGVIKSIDGGISWNISNSGNGQRRCR